MGAISTNPSPFLHFIGGPLDGMIVSSCGPEVYDIPCYAHKTPEGYFHFYEVDWDRGLMAIVEAEEAVREVFMIPVHYIGRKPSHMQGCDVKWKDDNFGWWSNNSGRPLPLSIRKRLEKGLPDA